MIFLFSSRVPEEKTVSRNMIGAVRHLRAAREMPQDSRPFNRLWLLYV